MMSCVRPIYGTLDLICGGQGRVYLQRWKTLIEAFEAAGIELVFVKDGPLPCSKRPAWVDRRYRSVEEFVYPVFDDLVSFNLRVRFHEKDDLETIIRSV